MEDTNDFNKMKVIDLRKELKARGLPSTGDKTMLIARLNAAMSQQDDHGDVTLDSDEIDSDGVLDEDDKGQSDNILDSLNEELVLAGHSPPRAVDSALVESNKPLHRTLKRKFTTDAAKKGDANERENKESAAKKIVLNRATSITLTSDATEKKADCPSETKKADISSSNDQVKITAEIDSISKLEQRAKRFGLPVKMTDAQRKEARKNRFSQIVSTELGTSVSPNSLADNIDQLKKRADRFGQSVSKIMTVIENKEKLEKRKAKFGTVK